MGLLYMLSLCLFPLPCRGITRQAILDTARIYAELEWTCYNTFTSVGKGNFYAGQKYIGEAYKFGGNDHWKTFLYKVEVLKLQPREQAGIDCSAFVSRCWQVDRHVTATLPNISHLITQLKLKPGDILDKPNSHVVLVESASLAGPVVVFESVGGTIARVVHRATSWSRYQWYKPYTLFNVGLKPERVSVSDSAGVVRVRAYVWNDGGKPMSCRLVLYADTVSADGRITSIPVTTHPRCWSEEVLLEWPGASSGEHTLILRLEEVFPDESDTTDNEVRIPVSVTWVAGADGPGLPEEYSLFPPYPNPFNSSVVVRFRIPEAAEVSLKVYDLRGRTVRSIAQGYFPVGEHTFLWDGMDEERRKAASGIYLCTLKVRGKGLLVRRMALVR
ncbi:MAG: hypothetical protein DRP95_01135 [Candidatus Latescibacterota bacterium]|nr:MAG: hypothetical protein DRP95_01135 [Candidatus Latescibacterota bacterium]